MGIMTVFMDGRRCGTVSQDRTGDLRFRYDERYRADGESTPLSLSMPLSFAEHRKRVILPYLEGLISDNVMARRSLATRYGVSPQSAFALLAHVGADVAGALQLIPDEGVPGDLALPRGGYSEMTETEVAHQLRAVVDEFRDGLPVGDVLGRFSLAGAQPKIALFRTEDGIWARPNGATPTTHILKPLAGGYRRLDVVEYLTMRAAALVGLDVAEVRLAVIGGFHTFVTVRYDRVRDGRMWRRLHQEDLCQALSVMPEKKYQRDDGGPGVARVGELLRGLQRIADRSAAVEAFYRGLMFATVAQCTDAHAKNYSLMLSGRQVRLAPLYDLATFAPYESGDLRAASAMKIGGEYRYAAIGERECLAAARTLRLPSEHAQEILRELRSGIAPAFEAARDELIDIDIDTETREFADEVIKAVVRLPLVRH